MLEVFSAQQTSQDVGEGQGDISFSKNQVTSISSSTIQGSLVNIDAELVPIFRSSKDLTANKNIPSIFNPKSIIRLLSSDQKVLLQNIGKIKLFLRNSNDFEIKFSLSSGGNSLAWNEFYYVEGFGFLAAVQRFFVSQIECAEVFVYENQPVPKGSNIKSNRFVVGTRIEYQCKFLRDILDYSVFQWMDVMSIYDSGTNYFAIRAN